MIDIRINGDTGKYFEELLDKSGIGLESGKLKKMMTYLTMLYEKNKVINLTAIRDKEGMLEKHFIDTLFLTELIRDEEKTFIDVGTGAGFPGLVLGIFYPEKEFLLVDSVKKKIDFINEVVESLKLKNVKTSSERAENLIKNKRESFDVALCRGVADLRIILEYMIPFIKVKGRFLPQKLNLNEVDGAENALKTLKSQIKEIYKFKLPESGDERVILEIVKNRRTDIKYPRKAGIPSKRPL